MCVCVCVCVCVFCFLFFLLLLPFFFASKISQKTNNEAYRSYSEDNDSFFFTDRISLILEFIRWNLSENINFTEHICLRISILLNIFVWEYQFYRTCLFAGLCGGSYIQMKEKNVSKIYVPRCVRKGTLRQLGPVKAQISLRIEHFFTTKHSL